MYVHDRKNGQGRVSYGRLSVFMHVTIERNEVLLISGSPWGVRTQQRNAPLATRSGKPHLPLLISLPIHQALLRDTTIVGRGRKPRTSMVGRESPAGVLGTWWLIVIQGGLLSQGQRPRCRGGNEWKVERKPKPRRILFPILGLEGVRLVGGVYRKGGRWSNREIRCLLARH